MKGKELVRTEEVIHWAKSRGTKIRIPFQNSPIHNRPVTCILLGECHTDGSMHPRHWGLGENLVQVLEMSTASCTGNLFTKCFP